MSCFSMPASASAQRSPAPPASAGRSWACRLRTRTARPAGASIRVSPTVTRPEWAVPVTTVPMPASVKTAIDGEPEAAARRAVDDAGRRLRQVGAQGGDALAGDGRDRKHRRIRQGRVGQQCRHFAVPPPRGVPASPGRSWSAPPRPGAVPSRSSSSRCSRVCGIGPSSAATTSSTKSMPVAPASMVWISLSWPGTSTKPSIRRRRQQRRVGIAEVERDAARLLLRQAVGVHAGERLHQGGLAVVDVAGGADDHADAHRGSGSCASWPANSASSWCARQRRSSRRAPSAMRPITGTGRPRRAASSVVQDAGPPAARTHDQARRGQPVHRQRAAADLAGHGLRRRPSTGQPARAARSAGSRRSAWARMSPSARVSRRSVGQSLGQAVRVAVEAQHGLQRGQRELADAQARFSGFFLMRRDQLPVADQHAGLRPAEQLVAAEGHQVGAGGDGFARRRLVRQAPARQVDQRAAAEVDHEGQCRAHGRARPVRLPARPG